MPDDQAPSAGGPSSPGHALARLAGLGDWRLVLPTRAVWFSPIVRQVLGFTPTEPVTPELLFSRAVPEDRAGAANAMARCLQDGTPISRRDRYHHPDGHVVSVEVRGHALRDAQGNITGAEGSVLDVTAQIGAQRQLTEALVGTLQTISRIQQMRDPYTGGHQLRVADLATAIARALKLPPERVRGVSLGAAIHDIGKLSLPLDILNRPGPLGPLEFALVKQHCAVGAAILEPVVFPWPLAGIVRQHHERMDGSGYPDGLKGDEILLEARIVAVADVVEAMASHRPYRPALGEAQGLAELRAHRGQRYDPAVVDACLALFEGGYQWPAETPVWGAGGFG